MQKPLFVANWKMNLGETALKAYFEQFISSFSPNSNGLVDTVFCPPFTLLNSADLYLRGQPGIGLGAQNVHWAENGAHTGEISVSMLKECGVSYVILGHSERRQFYGESSEFVAKRAKAALAGGLIPIVCIGETTYFENDPDSTVAVIKEQLHSSLSGVEKDNANRLVVAYEPVWAIGTGRAATPEIVRQIHAYIRSELVLLFNELGMQIPILYGGSTTPENIKGIMMEPNVNGALVGSTSLKPDQFWNLILAGRETSGN